MDDKHVHYHQENVYGDKYDIHDNPGATFNFGGAKNESRKAEEPTDGLLLEELKPFFFGDSEETARFIAMIQGMKGQDVTQLVSRLVREKKLSDLTCLKPLWTVLSRHGLYANAYSTWAANIDK